MNGGFDRSLENVQIKGNLTVVPESEYDGSIEASGTLYVNTITGYNPLEDLVIQNAIFTNDTIFIPHSAQSTASTGALILSGGLSITATSEASAVSAGGSITTLGGVSIGKRLYVGGPSFFLSGADMSNHKITSVTTPSFATDAANKEYVDLVAGRVSGDFSPGELIFGLGEGEGVLGSPYLKFNSTEGQLVVGSGSSGSIFIESYDPKSIMSFGGMDLYGPGLMRSGLDMNSTNITNLAEPSAPNDATTKSYVDTFAGDIRGTFGSSQVIFGFTENAPGTGSVIGSDQLLFHGSSGALVLGTMGSLVIENTGASTLTVNGDTKFLGGTNEFLDGNVILDGGSLNILTTTPATGLGSGGVLNIYGGASIYDKVWLNNGLDLGLTRITNVDAPIEAKDAVNKEYVDQLDIFGLMSSEFDYKIPLDNDVTTGTLLPDISYPNNVTRAFYSYGYIYQNTDNFGVFTLLGVYSPMKGWTITQYHIGRDITVEFSITTTSLDSSGIGTLEYTNPSLSGLANLRYKNAVIIKTISDPLQKEINVIGSPTNFTDIPQIYWLNSDTLGFTSYIYALDTITDESSFWVISGMLSRDSIWLFHSRQVSSTTDPENVIDFNIKSTGSSGILQYTSDNPLWIKTQNFSVKRDSIQYILNDTTFSFTDLLDDSSPSKPLIEFGKDSYKTKFLTLYIEIPDLNSFVTYYITAFLDFDRWVMSSQFIGDNVPEIQFRLRNSSGTAILQFKNELPVDAYLRYSSDVSVPVFTPLPVGKGGTGVRELYPDAVLRGNGTDPILGTSDLVYRNYQLELGPDSSILINNTRNATSLTSGDGVLTVLGGASIGQDTYIGGTLFMNGTQIKQVEDPTDPQDAVTKAYVDQLDVFGILNKDTIPLNEYELTRSLESNVTTPFSISDISYNSDVTVAFYSYAFVYQDTDRYAIFLLIGMWSPVDGWTLTQYHTGQDVDIQFSISPSGNLQYTNTSLSGVSFIKFKTGLQITPQTVSPQLEQILPATPNETTYMDTAFSYLNSNCLGVTLYIYTRDTSDLVSFWILTALQKLDGTWVYHSRKINDTQNKIDFRIRTGGGGGVLEYRSVDQVTIKFKEKKIANDSNYYFLYKNNATRVPIETLPSTKPNGDPIPPVPLFVFGQDGVKNKFLTMYIEVPELNKSSIYFLTALFDYDRWVLTTQFIGDTIPEIQLFIESSEAGANIGVLKYTNDLIHDAKMRFFYDIVTPVFNPLSVDKGGTGNRELLPFAVLRGSGTSPVVATEDFVYRDLTLRLGGLSKILLLNTKESTGLTDGTIVTNGGVSIKKSLNVGGDLKIQDVDVTPSPGDIWSERAFMAANSVFTPAPINGLTFSNLDVRSFMGIVSVHLNYNDPITNLETNKYSQYTLNGLQRDSDWLLKTDLLGENLFGLSIASNGQIYYTTGSFANWNYTKVKYRMMTTTN